MLFLEVDRGDNKDREIEVRVRDMALHFDWSND